jgi:hypothetical protein
MDYLLNINIIDLNPKMLGSTIFDFDSQFEINEKIGKFNEFSKNQIPKSNFLQLEQKDEQYDKYMTPSAEKGTIKILDHAKKLDFNSHEVPKKAEEAEQDEIQEDIKLTPLDGQENIDKQVSEFNLAESEALDAEGVAIIDDKLEGFSEIINDMEGESNKDSDNIMNLLSNNSVNQVQKDGDKAGAGGEKFRAKRKEEVRKKLAEEMSNIMLYKTQGKEEVIYLTQKGFETKEISKSNWVYLYGLPYHIEDEAALNDEIRTIFRRSIGEINKIKIFQYKDYLNVVETDRKVQVFDNLADVFDPENLIAAQTNTLTIGYDDLHEKTPQVPAIILSNFFP